jgi:hypothetical protein
MFQSPYIDLHEERRRVEFLKRRERVESLAGFILYVLGFTVVGAFVLQLTLLAMLGALDYFGKLGLLCAFGGGCVAGRLLIRGLLRLWHDRWGNAWRCWLHGSLRYERLTDEQRERGF